MNRRWMSAVTVLHFSHGRAIRNSSGVTPCFLSWRASWTFSAFMIRELTRSWSPCIEPIHLVYTCSFLLRSLVYLFISCFCFFLLSSSWNIYKYYFVIQLFIIFCHIFICIYILFNLFFLYPFLSLLLFFNSIISPISLFINPFLCPFYSRFPSFNLVLLIILWKLLICFAFFLNSFPVSLLSLFFLFLYFSSFYFSFIFFISCLHFFFPLLLNHLLYCSICKFAFL